MHDKIVLKEMDQTQLAYLTAATHGLTEELSLLKEYLTAKNIEIPAISEDCKPIIPLAPIHVMEENWPDGI